MTPTDRMADNPDVPAAVAVRDNSSNTALQQQQRCLEQLTSWYGFDPDVASHAIETVLQQQQQDTATTTLLEASCRYILDHDLAPDLGGPVTPIEDCPHTEHACSISLLDQLPHQPAHTVCTHSNNDINPVRRCTGTENWLCLTCGVIRCSRYVHGHALQHWQESTTTTNSGPSPGHCLAVSLSDLSVWCHACQAYVLVHASSPPPQLQTIVQTLEARKFSSDAEEEEEEAATMFLESNSNEPVKKKHKSDSEMDDDDDDNNDSSVEDGGAGGE